MDPNLICDMGPYRFTPFSRLYVVHKNMSASYILDDNGLGLFNPESNNYFRDVSNIEMSKLIVY
jgi:hypothetical protein